MTLERLYKRANTGKVQICDICTIEDVVQVSWGELDGKQQHQHTTCKGKNIGKSNETTPAEQAIIEAKAKWAKKSKANYSTSIEAPVKVYLPGKISTFEKHGKKLKWSEGVYESAKLNGVNILIRLVDNKLVATSRGGEPRTVPPHQIADLLKMMELLQVTELAGEQYTHGEHLQDITSAVTKPNKLTPKLVFSIFALPEMGHLGYKTMIEHLNTIGESAHLDTVEVSYGYRVDSEARAHENMEILVEQGYEGTVLHNHDSKYEYNKRSTTSMKLKPVLDAEFKTIAYKFDKSEHIVWICESAGGGFSVKCKGTAEQRLAMAEHPGDFIGKWLTVEYEMLSKDKKPLKPIGVCFRDCNPSGEPLE